MIEIIRRSLRMLGRKKGRTILTVISIAIGVASVVIISSIGEIGKSSVEQELQSLGLDGISVGKSSPAAASPLNDLALETVRVQPGVQAAAGLNTEYTELHMRSLVANGVVWGIEPAAAQFISMETIYGRLINQYDVRAGTRVCVLDQTVAQSFYKRTNVVGKTIRLKLGEALESFTVVGIVRSGGSLFQGLLSSYVPGFVYIPSSTMQQLTMKADFDQIAVKVTEPKQAEETGDRIIQALESSSGIRNGYRIQNITQQKESLNRLLEIVTQALSLIAGVSLIVAGLGIMTVMLVSVRERTREIGIKKSIGARSRVILLEFLTEALAISLIGSLAGALVGVFFVTVGCLSFQMEAAIRLDPVFQSIAFSVLAGTVFGVYPACVAAKLRPVDALRTL